MGEKNHDYILEFKSVINAAVALYARNSSPEQQDDIRQEAYLALLKKEHIVLPIYKRSKDEAEDYVYRLVRNKINDVYGKEKHHRKQESLSDDAVFRRAESGGQWKEEDAPEFNPRFVEVRKAVDRLPSDEQQVVTQLFTLGNIDPDAAKAMGLTMYGFRQVKKRALDNLKRLLGE